MDIILTLETDIVFDFVDFFNRDVTVGLVTDLPDNFTFGVGQFSWRSKVVEVIMVDVSVYDQCNRFEAVRFKHVGFFDLFALFLHHLVFGPEVFRFAEGIGLCNTAAEGVYELIKDPDKIHSLEIILGASRGRMSSEY